MVTKHTISFKHAFDGVLWALSSQPNFRIHVILSLIAVYLSWYFQISIEEFIVIVLVITGGLVVEMINTAIEATTDAISKDFHKDIKIAKDVSAGAMLVYAIGALVIAYLIFGARLVLLIQQ